MNFLSVLYAKAGITVDGVTTLNNTATGLTPATNDNSTKLATTGYVKNQNYYPYPTGTTAQYVRGDGSLATFTQTGGGGSSVSYYLNGSVSQGTIGGNAYYEMSKNAIIGTNADFSINADGYVAQFVTDAGDPALLSIPGGNWNFEMWFSASSGGGTPSFYVELYKYDGTTLTLIASGSAAPESITGGTSTDLYITALAVPTTTLTLTDRLAVRVYVNHSGRTITLHTQNGHLCQVITSFTTGLTALNGLTAQVQNFAVGTGGTDFNISSVTDTHTFNLPTASATKRGALSSIDWSAFDAKVDFGDLSATSPLNYNGSGVFSIAQSSTSTNGYLSSTDWNTFNNKQNALTNPITGTGTTNYLPKFTGTSALGNSLLQETTNAIGLNVTPKAWGNSNKVFETTFSTSLLGRSDFSAFGRNFFYNSGDDPIYSNNGFASGYFQVDGEHLWVSAASGTAGNTISFTQAMTLTANGRLGIGTTSPSYKFQTSASVNSDWVGSFYNTSTTTPNGLQVRVGVSSTAQALGVYTDGIGYTFNVLGNGNTLIGTTTDAGYKLDVNGVGRFTNGVIIGSTQAQYATSGGNTYLDYAGTLNIRYNFGAVQALALNSSGAATFSSSVTATDAILSNIKPSINFTLSVNPAFSHSIVGENYSSGAAANNYMDFKVANAANTQQLALRLFGTGAAEFSSSVTANGTGGSPALNIKATDTNFALASILGNQTGDVSWLLMSGYPNAGDFTIRQSDTIDALTIKKTTGNATFSSSVTATNFIGAGTGLTGTASALSIGGNAAYATTAGSLTSMNISQFTNDAGYITSTSSTFSYTASVTLSPTWQNTGVSSANLTGSGVYIVTCNANDFGVSGGQYNCTYTGIMYWFAGGTNGSNVNEIVLHHTGHADNGRYIYLRTLSTVTADGKTYLQISGNGTNSGASNYQLTFKKIL